MRVSFTSPPPELNGGVDDGVTCRLTCTSCNERARVQGTLYLGEMRGSEERASVMQLHDDASGVVVVAKCADYVLSHYPQYAEGCAQLLPAYSAYNFEALVNSTFSLIPGGGSPGTHRLAEVSMRMRKLLIHTYVSYFHSSDLE